MHLVWSALGSFAFSAAIFAPAWIVVAIASYRNKSDHQD